MKPELLSLVDKAKIAPLDSRRIHFLNMTPETLRIIQANSLSFRARELLELNGEDIILLSKRLRLMFTRIASQYGLRMGGDALDFFKEGEGNGLLHELRHLEEVQQARPELVDQSSINILPVRAPNNQLGYAMNVMIPIPDVKYTIMEKAKIQLAPVNPSIPDYNDLYRYIQENRDIVTRDDIRTIAEMVKQKRKSEAKNNFLAYLSEISN